MSAVLLPAHETRSLDEQEQDSALNTGGMRSLVANAEWTAWIVLHLEYNTLSSLRAAERTPSPP